ncbi:MAG: carboxypeptidase regulatory-like domain-containing protein, partial [Alphaproteobacteria bacterium]
GTLAGTAFIQPASGRATVAEGAVVTVSGDGMEARERIPTENGAFKLELPPGTYQAIATLRGHRGQSQSFEIKAGATTNLRLPLTPTG